MHVTAAPFQAHDNSLGVQKVMSPYPELTEVGVGHTRMFEIGVGRTSPQAARRGKMDTAFPRGLDETHCVWFAHQMGCLVFPSLEKASPAVPK